MYQLIQIRKLAERKEDENLRFRQFLKNRCNLESDEIDGRVFETTRRVWTGIDCTSLCQLLSGVEAGIQRRGS